jgi:hypothetical protein
MQVPDIIDNAYVIVEFDNGCRGMLDLCMFAEGSKNEQEISVVGDIGKVEPYAFAILIFEMKCTYYITLCMCCLVLSVCSLVSFIIFFFTPIFSKRFVFCREYM